MADDRDPTADPGWGGYFQGLLVLVPGGLQHFQSKHGSNPLVMLRGVFAAMVFADLLVGGVVVLLTTTEGFGAGTPSLPVAIGVAVWGALSLVFRQVVSKPLDCSTDATLAGSYRTRFFLRMASANSAALVGFVGVLLSGTAWPYAVGLVFSVVGLAASAPSRRQLAADQEALGESGCGRVLLAALQAPPPAASD